MFQEAEFRKLRYLLKFPKGYDPVKKYPTVIFMHGAGTRGENIEKIKENPFFTITENMQNFPFIVAAPLCNKDTWFDLLQTVNEFAKHINDRFDVDKSSFYAMGVSMGGYAVWQMAMSCPQLYSAIVPICGGGMYWNVGRLLNIPVWAFHGDSDGVVFTDESRKMVNRLNALGGNAKLTVYENCQHDAWTQTYSNPKVFSWLLEQKLKTSSTKSNEYNDSKIYG